MGTGRVIWALLAAWTISMAPSMGLACPYCILFDSTSGEPVFPLVIRNPYVPWPFEADTVLCPARPTPLRIVNPMVAQPGDPGIFPDAVLPREPLVVRPILLGA